MLCRQQAKQCRCVFDSEHSAAAASQAAADEIARGTGLMLKHCCCTLPVCIRILGQLSSNHTHHDIHTTHTLKLYVCHGGYDLLLQKCQGLKDLCLLFKYQSHQVVAWFKELISSALCQWSGALTLGTNRFLWQYACPLVEHMWTLKSKCLHILLILAPECN